MVMKESKIAMHELLLPLLCADVKSFHLVNNISEADSTSPTTQLILTSVILFLFDAITHHSQI
jgi:hypothetical protein